MTSSKHYILIFLFLLSGCGFYSFKGALPPELQNIYIEDFRTTTAFYNVEQNLTVGVTNSFLEDNSLTIVNDKTKADLILKGRITSVKWENYSVAEGAASAKEDRLTVYVSVDCYRTDLKKSLWKKQWNRYALIPSTATQDEIESALDVIIEELSEDVVINTVATW